ncbi:hypothetical protein H2201_001871 [Coniosporium apollinis]|uniref:GDP/GTP exchange factor Sec2 N-terminal domain-containing protein n=1 Tax=Coniosporium apollinis TaxID=61459 RepID=A0ABQ9P3B6_9PEZI|nr:hypothetical protein H2201_001871 [Coniosporium apollinis]
MSPPPLPLATPGGTIPTSAQSTHHPFPPLSPSVSSTMGGPTTAHTSVDAAGVPMRHPRPLTAAELHLELEKEQEAVVNRLTRELSSLRAHSASVASTASSASAAPSTHSYLDTSDHPGATHPTSRRHRSSSSASRAGSISGGSGYTVAGAQASLPIRAASYTSNVVATSRYEEVALQRQELEEAKRENEALRRRIRELEAEVRRRGSVGGEARATGGAQGSSGAGGGGASRMGTGTEGTEGAGAAPPAAGVAVGEKRE